MPCPFVRYKNFKKSILIALYQHQRESQMLRKRKQHLLMLQNLISTSVNNTSFDRKDEINHIQKT